VSVAFRCKFCALFATLLVCLAVVMVVECQLHSMSFEQTHAADTNHHQGSAIHSIDFSCIIAILPAIMFFTLLLFFMFCAMPLCLRRGLHSFPLFVPPRYLSL
jgi:ABC-type sulfate transport system permease component